MYTVDEAIQKNSVAIVASMMEETLVILPEKTSGENTKKFLIHCLGLNNFNKSMQLCIEKVKLLLCMLTGRKLSVSYINCNQTKTVTGITLDKLFFLRHIMCFLY
jgi:hypothetical protein